MKYFRFVFIVLVFLGLGKFTESSAQKLRIGLRAGGQLSSRVGYKNADPLISYHFGGIVRLGTEKHRFQGELLYSRKGISWEPYRNPYLDLPLLYNRKIFKVMYVEGGIQPSLLLKFFSYRHRAPIATGKSDIAILAGIGVEIKKFHIGFRGSYGLVNQTIKDLYTVIDEDDPVYQNLIRSSHNASIMVTAGFIF